VRGLAVAGIAVVLWLTTPAQAQVVFTGNTFFDYCSAREDSLSAGLCLGYIQGVLESSTSTCIIPGVTFGQLKDVVVRFLRTNPQNRHNQASLLVEEAIQEAWPCPR